MWDNLSKKIESEFHNNKERFLATGTTRNAIGSTSNHLCAQLWKQLCKDPDLERLKDPGVGYPAIYKDGYSQSTLRSLSYIREMQNFGIDLDQVKYVTEFGAGYGNFCRIFNTLFNPESYTVVDLPEMQELQKHFLSKTVDKEIAYKTWNDDLRAKPSSLFFATFSLDECEYLIRDKVMHEVMDYDYIFIAHCHVTKQMDINNEMYFRPISVKLMATHEVKYSMDTTSGKFWLVGKK